jgi:hypothetical protein
MTERWVCKRCYTSADPKVAACPNCGLARGAEPASAAGAVTAGDADAPRAEPGTARPVIVPPTPTSRAVSPPDPPAPYPAGAAGDAMSPFENAKIELARSGRRRVFACGRCGKGISLAWKKCEHCKATFDDFPPIDTGQDVQSDPDIPLWWVGG